MMRRLLPPAILAWLACMAALGQSPPTEASAREAFQTARTGYENGGSNAVAAWEFGRAAYDLAEFIQETDQRNEVAEVGIEACRQAVRLDPASAPAHYYLALNLGQLARGKKLGALRILPEMEGEFLTAAELDPGFDYAGPHRSLGLLYLQAPGWPLSVGNRNKARSHLSRAIALHPEYPENHLSLMEAYAKWNEPRNLERELKNYRESLPQWQAKFGRDKWAAAWADWEKRLAQLEQALGHLKSHPPVSPAERGARRNTGR